MGVDDDSHTNMVMKKFLVEIHGLMGTKLQFFFFVLGTCSIVLTRSIRSLHHSAYC